MQSRLTQQSLRKIYHSGCGGLSFDAKNFEKSHLKDLDFEKILCSQNPKAMVQKLSAQTLYLSLREHPELCLEVLPYISKDQFQRVLDYDVWEQDNFLPERVLYWTQSLSKISSEQVYEKFSLLEEEYQISTLSPFLRVYDQEAYDNMTERDQDQLERFPGDALFYSIQCENSELRAKIKTLIEDISSSNMNYAMSLVSHSALLPPNESVLTASQFRRARLEEDGFVSYEESLLCFAPFAPESFKKEIQEKLSKRSSESLLPTLSKRSDRFLEQVMEAGDQIWLDDEKRTLEQGMAFLANSLCTACSIETDDLSSLKFLFTNTRALCSLGLEYVSEGQLLDAIEICKKVYAKDLFKTGLNLVRESQSDLLKGMKDLRLPRVEVFEQSLLELKFALALDWIDKNLIDRIGFQEAEIMKACFNRFPQYPVEIAEEDAPKRIAFLPVSSLKTLDLYKQTCQRILTCLQN